MSALDDTRVALLTPERDRWGRPLVPDGETGKLTPYSRPSTVAKALSDTTNLKRWASRMTAIGLAKSDDLIAAVATTRVTDNRTLDRIVEQAQERAQATAGRTTGTAIHTATEALDRGEDVSHLPASIRRDAEAYRRAIAEASLTPEVAELFVVCDELQVAGTLDRVYRSVTGAFGVGDIKTSSNPDSAKWAALEWAIQVALYAHSVPFCAERGRLTWDYLGLAQPTLESGVVVHIVQGKGRARLYRVDVAQGWEYAKLAVKVRDARKVGPRLVGAL